MNQLLLNARAPMYSNEYFTLTVIHTDNVDHGVRSFGGNAKQRPVTSTVVFYACKLEKN